jgi:transcriptional regulator with XRE-family HTH domain
MPSRKSRTIRNKSQNDRLIKLLRELRLQAGLTQVELANRLNFPQSFVSKYEAGERRLDLFELQEICGLLNIPFRDFISKLEEKSINSDET